MNASNQALRHESENFPAKSAPVGPLAVPAVFSSSALASWFWALRSNLKSFSSAVRWAAAMSSSSAKRASLALSPQPCRDGLASLHPSTNWNSIATITFPPISSALNSQFRFARVLFFAFNHTKNFASKPAVSTAGPLAHFPYLLLNFVHTVLQASPASGGFLTAAK